MSLGVQESTGRNRHHTTITSSDLLAKILFPVLMGLRSTVLEDLVPKGEMQQCTSKHDSVEVGIKMATWPLWAPCALNPYAISCILHSAYASAQVLNIYLLYSHY